MSENNKGLGVLFLYIGIGIALLFSVVSGIRTAFGIINHLVPSDMVGWYQLHKSTEMPISAAFLVIACIILVIILRKTRGAVNEHQGTIWYTLYRTIIYIILTVSVGMMAVAISILLGETLSGEIALNNALKTLFVAGVGAAVFYYYRGILRGTWRTRKKQERFFAGGIGVLVGVLVLGTVIIANPLEQPALRRTYEKLDCIQSFSHIIEGEYTRREKDTLPAVQSYKEFIKDHHMRTECEDAGITYTQTDETQYRLCASFEILPKGTETERYPYQEFEVTNIGENCFDMSVEK